MMPNGGRIACFTLSLLILINSAVFYISFLYQKKEHRSFLLASFDENAPNSRVFIITSSNHDEFRFVEHGKEFWYKNEIYDVVKSFDKDGVLKVLAIRDKRENSIFKGLTLLNNEKDNGKKNDGPQLKVSKYIVAERLQAEEHFILLYTCGPTRSDSLFPEDHSMVFSPPPELIS